MRDWKPMTAGVREPLLAITAPVHGEGDRDNPKPASPPENLGSHHTIMPIKVRVQEPLRRLLENQQVVEINSRTVIEAIEELQRHYPGVRDRVLDETGAVRGFVNIYVNEENIRFLQDEQTPLKDGDELSIVPASSGG